MRTPSRSRIFAAATLLAMLPLASVQAADARATLQQFTDGLQGLDGRFVQRVFDGGGRMNEESQGRVELSAPRQFRWEYAEPFPQLIVADGDHVWIYDPDLEQVQVRTQSYEEQSSPLAALIDPAELDRQFDVSDGGPGDGVEWVVLTPKGDEAQFDSARLGFAGGQLQRMEMRDGLGQRTEISFEGWKRNPGFAADTFRFEPPPGVDVIGEIKAGAEVMPLGD